MKNLLLLLFMFITTKYSTNAQSNDIGSGIALKFSTNNYLELGNVFDDLDFPFTFETWVNPSGLPASRYGLFTTDNDIQQYAGWYVRLTSAGKIEIEFGNGFGSGFQYRRGFVSSSSIPLNKWSHIAIVCYSISDIDIFFNGVNQNIAPTDGISSSTEMFHSEATASIGKYSNVFDSQYFNGQLDEIRVWSTARAENKIRNFMCQKVDINEPDLVAYWKADESYSSNTVVDYTNPSENGVIVGTVVKQNSGAPIGDKSNYEYTTVWTDKKIVVNASGGDQFMVKNVTGSPAGIHVYQVNSTPESTSGLGSEPGYYFGAYCATINTVASYKVRYSYSLSNGLIDLTNENQAALSGRSDNSINTWLSINAKLDTVGNTLARFNQASRGEYILNLQALEKLESDQSESSDMTYKFEVFAYPNPAKSMIVFSIPAKTTEHVRLNIVSLSGELVKQVHFENGDQQLQIDLADLEPGVYLAEAFSNAGLNYCKFEVLR